MRLILFSPRLAAVLAAVACSGAIGQPLSLEDALRAGDVQSPRLAAQRQAIVAADQQAARATELPDPKGRVGIENLPVTGADRFRYDRDFMTSRAIGLVQEFPSQAKRAARGERAQRVRGVEQGVLYSQEALLHRDIAVAWIDVHFAERARESLQQLVSQLSTQSDLASAGIARGRQSAAEGLMLRGSVEQARDRILDQDRIASRARIALAALIGDEAARPLAAAPEFSKLEKPREFLLTRLHEHPQLRVYDLRQDLARAEVELAKTAKNPDWSLEVGYGQRRPFFDNMLTVMVSFDLPWQADRRQERDISTRLAELEQSRALREEARRMHEAELRGWLADFDAATARITRYREIILPLARERHEASLAAYRGGRGDLNPVLDASRSITDSQLALIAVEAERARAWANLGFLYPHEGH